MFEAEPARPGQNIAVSGRIREKRRQRHAAENKSIEHRKKKKRNCSEIIILSKIIQK